MSDFPVPIEPVKDDLPELSEKDTRAQGMRFKAMAKKEQTEILQTFARMIFAGTEYSKAFVLSGLADQGDYANEVGLRNAAAKWAAKPEVVALIDQLREKTKKVMEYQVGYDLKQALSEAQTAYNVGLARGDAKAMVQAVFLKCKVTGLLVEDRKNDRSPIDDLTGEELDAYLQKLRNEIEAIEGTAKRVN